MNCRSIFVVFITCALLAGCGWGGKKAQPSEPAKQAPAAPTSSLSIDLPPEPSPEVHKIDLWTLPAPVNLDDRPGSDGAQIQFRFFRLDQPLAFALDQGWLEVVFYDGRISPKDLASAEPMHVQSFTASQLRGYSKKTVVGIGYGLTLPWIKTPKEKMVTVTARLLRPEKRSLYAMPVYLSVSPR